MPGPIVGPGGVVFAASNGGVLHALDVRDGSERWRFDGGSPYGADLSSSPLLLSSGLLVWPGPGDALYGVDSENGRLQWKLPLGAQPLSPVPSADERSIYVSDTSGDLHALAIKGAERPRRRWSLDLSEISYGSPVRADDDTLRATVDASLVAIADRDGEGRELWRFDAARPVEVSPAVARDGTAVLGTNDPFTYGVGPDGRERWRYRRDDWTYSSTAVTASGLAFFGDHRGFLDVVDVQSGRLVARHLGQGRRPGANNVGIWTSPAIDRDQNVYFGTHAGKVYGFSWSGRRLFEIDTGGVVDSYPALAADGTLLIGSETGELYAIADRWRSGASAARLHHRVSRRPWGGCTAERAFDVIARAPSCATPERDAPAPAVAGGGRYARRVTGPDHGQQIGARLRGARTRRGLSLTHVAAKSGVTKGFLSQVERDLTSPSVGTLLRVCAALELSIAELFAVSQGALVRAGERAAISFGGEGVDEFQLTPAGENRILVLHSDIAPGGGSGRDAYRLPSDAEFVHVIAGTLDVEVAGASYRLAAGDSLTFEARTEHRWCNPSPSWPTRVIWVLTPAPR